ncbi:MAG: pseudaminic acid biosynthesis-associated methylase [Pseudomonadota bacterium]
MSKNDKKAATPQLSAWTGDFGDQYVNRNNFAEWKLDLGVEAFRRMIGSLQLVSVLEVGSNIGLNLLYIEKLFGGTVGLHAVEPNQKAFGRLCNENPVKLKNAWNCTAFEIPLPDASVDLVFTSGVLIHIAPEDLGRVTDEIVRVSKKYVLCNEYFAHRPEEVSYHGKQGLLWKRDFGLFYKERYPDLQWLKYGFHWEQEFPFWDNLNWWLFEKKC